jgi:hypothetical protein
VGQANTKLEAEVRTILDRLASEGVLQTLRRKWVGDLVPLRVTDVAAETSTTP